MKIKLKVSLKNITSNKIDFTETKAIKQNNKIIYTKDDTKHTINYQKESIILVRENNDLKSIMPFTTNKKTICEYTIKEKDITLEIPLKTKSITKTDTKLMINYIIEDSQEEYIYEIEMSE